MIFIDSSELVCCLD